MLFEIFYFVFTSQCHISGRSDNPDFGSQYLECEVEPYLVVSGSGTTVRYIIGSDFFGIIDDGYGLEDSFGTDRNRVGPVS